MASQLEQDQREVELLLGAAEHILREKGADRVTVREVLAQAGLGTRAFYRHFASHNELVLEVFARGARREAERLRQNMDRASDPLGAVIAWIDGRLDLAFNRRVASDLQSLSMAALLRRCDAPADLRPVTELMLAPLVERLAEGRTLGLFPQVDPPRDAHSIHDVVWGVVERQWAGARRSHREARDQVLRFCLRAIGAPMPVVQPNGHPPTRPRDRR